MRRFSLNSTLFAIALLGGISLGGGYGYGQEVKPDDNLNATLWTQESVEFKGNAIGQFALARFRLEQAFADKNWTAAPAEQKGDYQKLPPAIVLDVDETVLDNSRYQAWTIQNSKSYDNDTWAKFCNAQVSTAVPGAVEFLRYANARGIKIFYVTNRAADLEESTRANMKKLGFPMGGNVDTFLMNKEKPDWSSAKGTRRAFVAKDYRILLLVGDNMGDFTDSYKGNPAERLKVMKDNKDHWGKDWIVIANPTYGSWESAAFHHDFKKSPEEQRKAKRDQLDGWNGN